VRDFQSVALAAHRLEALLPFKHVYVFALGQSFPTNIPYDDVSGSLERSLADLAAGFSSPEELSQDLEPQVWVADRTAQRLYLKLVHHVYSEEWERVGETRKELKKHWRRHPVVIAFRPMDGLATVSFPGFTQGSGTPHDRRMKYPQVAEGARQVLRETARIETVGLPLKNAIEALLKERPDEVQDIRRIVAHRQGKFVVDSGEGEENVADYLAIVSRELQLGITKEVWREFISKGTADDIHLVWPKLKILTRVSFYDIAPEFLFVWRAGGRDSLHVDHVVRQIEYFCKKAALPLLSEAAEFVKAQASGTLLKPSNLIQRFNLAYEDSMELLRDAMRRSLVRMCFRVRTENALNEITNEWRSDLHEFPSRVTDIQGNSINLEDPASIEIAFQRV
jgi:hypothetical protein